MFSYNGTCVFNKNQSYHPFDGMTFILVLSEQQRNTKEKEDDEKRDDLYKMMRIPQTKCK